jgi:DNA-binding YbaB/EbfC family protein
MANMNNMDMSSLLKQAQTMQDDMQKSQEQLEKEVIEGSAGGGMVKVRLSGKKKLLSIKIDPTILDPDDVQENEDILLEAVNQAIDEADKLSGDEMSKVAPKLPDGFKIPGF